MSHTIIIGNGISGVTAARFIRKKSKNPITIISSETDYFFSRTALMYVYMGHMKFEHTQPYENDFWSKNNITLKKAHVSKVVPEENKLVFSSGEELSFDNLIIATGSKTNKFGWEGQDSKGVIGMYHKQDLEELESLTPNIKKAVIVGGGLIGIELAEMLRSRNIEVSFLVRESSYWNGVLPKEESELINRHIIEHHIDLQLNTELDKILADEQGNVRGVTTKDGKEISCEFVGLAAGVSPNIDFLKDSGIELGRGVKVNRLLQTNFKNIFAIGDCAEQHEAIGNRKPIEAVWYTGRMMGETVAQTILGKPTEYKPGHWFNSAKFLDIEYQTYGWVFPNPKDNEKHFYWEYKDGKKAIRLVYDKGSRVFIGINTFGIRMRHDFFDEVLRKEKSVDYVIKKLKKANFDPEFYKQYHKEIEAKFNKEN